VSTLALDDILRHGFDEFGAFVNPLIAQRARLAQEPIEFVRAEAGRLIDADGNVFEDFHGTQMLGHRNAKVAAAVRAYLDSDAPNWFPSRVNPLMGRLARRLCERTGYDNAYFGMSGADAVEAAIKLARALTRRPGVLGLERAYHGCSYGAVSLMHAGPLHEPFAPHLPGARRLPFGDVEALAQALGAGDVGAVVVEPIQGEGGIRPLSRAYVEALCELTERHGTLLVADEVQTSLGRCGRFLASSDWPRRPDAVLIAKTLGGGLVPISAMLTRRELFERAYGRNLLEGEAHNSTFGNNGLGAVAALATLDLLSDELIARVERLGGRFRAALGSALSGNPLFEEVRGAGFMTGIQLRQFDHPWLSFEHLGWPELADHASVGPLLCHRIYPRGFFVFFCGHDWSVLRLQPRFDVPEETLDRFTEVCREELSRLAERVA
jgi:acetylornithine/succinyldiaminopimelate/putrescine aminotransferase